MGSEHDFGPIGKSRPAGIVGVIRAAHLNQKRAREKKSAQSDDKRCPASPPEPIRADNVKTIQATTHQSGRRQA
jgi:hypothetical protein